MHASLFRWPLMPVTAFLTASTSACRATCCACAPALVGLPRDMLCLSLRRCAWPRPYLLRGLHGARRGREEELVQEAEARVLREEHAGSRQGEARTGERGGKYNSTLLIYFVNNF